MPTASSTSRDRISTTVSRSPSYPSPAWPAAMSKEPTTARRTSGLLVVKRHRIPWTAVNRQFENVWTAIVAGGIEGLTLSPCGLWIDGGVEDRFLVVKWA